MSHLAEYLRTAGVQYISMAVVVAAGSPAFIIVTIIITINLRQVLLLLLPLGKKKLGRVIWEDGTVRVKAPKGNITWLIWWIWGKRPFRPLKTCKNYQSPQCDGERLVSPGKPGNIPVNHPWLNGASGVGNSFSISTKQPPRPPSSK